MSRRTESTVCTNRGVKAVAEKGRTIVSRLIDAKQLEKQVKEAFETQNPVLMGQMLRWIRMQKTVDAVTVVRCRDCKHRYEDSWCEYVDDDDNFYCARGEWEEGSD